MNVNTHKHKEQAGPAFHRDIQNCQSLVPNLLGDVCKWLVQVGVSHEKITDVQIVMAEALNNVIEHGFASDNSGHIGIDIEVANGSIVAEISDNGKEFTPPEANQTPLQDNDDFDHLPEGGFGWILIREITTSYTFHRIANENRLILNFQ
jgi:serine/threonine-protein kinase RsbW